MAKDKTPLEIMEDFDPWNQGGEAQSLSDFPPEVQQDVNGLMFLGHLEETYHFCGHSFTLRTIKGGEELAASLVCKEFNDTLGQARAWTWAVLAQSVTTIDGDEDWCPDISNNDLVNARARFSYLSNNWYWPSAAFLFSKYGELVDRQATAIRAMEDLSNGSLHTFTPFAGSSKPQGDSLQDPPKEDIRQYLDEEDSTDFNSDSSASNSDEN